MATTELKLKGKVYWARVFEDNRDMTGAKDPSGNPYQPDIRDVNDGQYTLELHTDDLEELFNAGSQTVDYSKPSHIDGHTSVRFKRMHKKYSREGKLLDWASGPPKVSKSDGSAWSFEDDGAIGNDSEVEVTVSVYGTGRFVGTRLDSITVLNHVPVEEADEAS